MKISKVARAIPLLPGVWVSSLRHQKSPAPVAYEVCQQWAKRLFKVLGYRLEVRGENALTDLEGVYFVSNHQGTLDPALIVASCPIPVSFISKSQNETLPIMGRWARNIGCIHFDRDSREGNVHMLRESLRCLKRKQNLLIFPEGTRSMSDAMNPFIEKSLQPAIMTRSIIVPVVLNHAYCLDRKDYRRKDISITYGKPLYYDDYKDMELEALNTYLHAWIHSKIEPAL